ncbi:carbamoyl phosphate synthase large subunit [Cupriavidus sp. USMAA2-4]|uniref:ATP-grasp domain-containing protein n=1 Tax=Cupriavidus sp. USMAA2-4 TaxID=876364 RepID=UPI0008A6A297|nr:ATP-grasp domain-containing protein [Cupriavidus sp. USMAA2-4]AOY91525.1 carbamoyl phosphate synthase large subunit [Cupriavidus sp. USMAA2-4]
MQNVLLLSAGRRVELAQAFALEIKKRELPAKILATDMKPGLSAACRVVDEAISAPRVTDPIYIDFLLETCKKNQVALVIPTIDTELLLLAQHRAAFSEYGISIIVADENLVSQCRDKRLTADLFSELEIDTPEIFDRSTIQYPCFAKPYDGSNSVGAMLIQDEHQLTDSLRSDEKMMFMEFIDRSHTEFTVDAYYNKSGDLSCLVPRQRIEVRGGEVNKGVTRRNHVYDYLLPKLKKLKGARGCITVQVFSNQETGRFAALEINPRFGGGYPLSYSAGANYPGWLLDEYILQKEITFFDNWEADLLMLRYDAKVLVHGAS